MGAGDSEAGGAEPQAATTPAAGDPPRRGLARVLPRSAAGASRSAAILLFGLASGLMLQNWSDNQTSHYDLIRALDAGRTTIDQGPYPTKDEAYYRGHWYSARAPGLALFSLPFYETLNGARKRRVSRAPRPRCAGEDEMIDFVGLVGQRAARLPAGAAGLARGRALRAGLRRGRRDRARARARWCCRSPRCCSRTSSRRCSASPPSRCCCASATDPRARCCSAPPASPSATRSPRSTRWRSSRSCSACTPCRGRTRCARWRWPGARGL